MVVGQGGGLGAEVRAVAGGCRLDGPPPGRSSALPWTRSPVIASRWARTVVVAVIVGDPVVGGEAVDQVEPSVRVRVAALRSPGEVQPLGDGDEVPEVAAGAHPERRALAVSPVGCVAMER